MYRTQCVCGENFRWINPKYDCIYHFLIDFEPNKVHRRDWGGGNESEGGGMKRKGGRGREVLGGTKNEIQIEWSYRKNMGRIKLGL